MEIFARADEMPISGQLIYRQAERCFDVIPHPADSFTSLLVNDIQLEVDEQGRLVYVWGYCPHEAWKKERLMPPFAPSGGLRYVGIPFLPGVSKRINVGEHWHVFYDIESHCICVGDKSSRGESIEFAPGATAVLKDGRLTALWLRPDIRE